MKAFRIRLLPVAILCFSLLSSNQTRKPNTGFLNRTVSLNGVNYRYQVYVPLAWDKRKRWPVILFLHGAGERGDDGLLETDVGIGTAIRQQAERFPVIVVMPQCRRDKLWTQSDMLAQAMAATEESLKEFNGDQDRLYLTGISMGGYGTWELAAAHPGKFAALLVICGGIYGPPQYRQLHVSLTDDPRIRDAYQAMAERIGKTPVWIFHGAADDTVPAEESRKMALALHAEMGNVKYTEYPGVGHNSWDRAYAEPGLVPWLLNQKLR